jgi:drug/metabolite transporter (DMT)-like permease
MVGPVLIAAALGAALLLAVGFVLQQHEAAGVPAGRPGPVLLAALARRPVWLAGIAAMIGGQVLGAVALGAGSLVIVEPLLATNVLFALPLAAVASRRRLSRADWLGAVMLVGGLVLFLTGEAARTATNGLAHPGRRIPAGAWLQAGGALVAVVLVLLGLARHRPPRVRAALLAAAAGALFGMQDFLTKHAIGGLDRGVGTLLASWSPWVLAAVAVLGLTLAQRAFGLADLSASLPAINLAEPLCGMALSVGVAGAALPHRPLPLAATAVGLVLMVSGVVLLTRSPLVVDPHGKRRRHAPASRPPRRPTPVGRP